MENSGDFDIIPFEKGALNGVYVSASDSPEKLIFLLHGYMGDVDSNLDFAKKIAANVPSSRVVLINGLTQVPALNDPHHRQWFELDPQNDPGALGGFTQDAPELQQRLIAQMQPRMHFTAGILNRLIVATAREFNVSLADCAVAGISQGGMTAFEMVLFRPEINAAQNHVGALAIIGAGIVKPERLLNPLRLPAIPVLLAIGNQDEFFPPKLNDFSQKMLERQGLPVSRFQTDSVHFGLEHKVAGAVFGFLNGVWQKK